MPRIKAIGFDLFNTLIMAQPDILDRAFPRLQQSLEKDDINCNKRPQKRKEHYVF